MKKFSIFLDKFSEYFAPKTLGKTILFGIIMGLTITVPALLVSQIIAVTGLGAAIPLLSLGKAFVFASVFFGGWKTVAGIEDTIKNRKQEKNAILQKEQESKNEVVSEIKADLTQKVTQKTSEIVKPKEVKIINSNDEKQL